MEIRDDFKNLTQLMMTQDHVIPTKAKSMKSKLTEELDLKWTP